MKSPVYKLLGHEICERAFKIACEMFVGDTSGAITMFENIRIVKSATTFIEKWAISENKSIEDVLASIVRSGFPQIISGKSINISIQSALIVDSLPLLPIYRSDFGVVTVATPILGVEKTEAVQNIQDAYGALRVHVVIVPPQDFIDLYSKASSLGKIIEVNSSLADASAYWNYLVAHGCATGTIPTSQDEQHANIRRTCSIDATDEKRFISAAILGQLPVLDYNTNSAAPLLPNFTPRIQRNYSMTPISTVGRVTTMATYYIPKQRDKTAILDYSKKTCYILSTVDAVEKTISGLEGNAVSAHDIANRIVIDTTGIIESRVEEINMDSLANSTDNTAASAVDLVQAILVYGIQNSATDIHISQQPDHMMVRFRVDGFLSNYPHKLAANLTKSVIARIKVLADISTQYSAIPLDGKFALRVRDQNYDVRVATTITGYGEKAVLRLLSNDTTLPILENLGYKPFEKSLLEQLIACDHGLGILCGPTGAGKTTTLAATVGLIDRKKYAVVSGEAPIERQILDIDQTNITTSPTNQAGLTFSRFVEAALRQDPDYIVIGETRDADTARQAIRAAMTGHVVLTTLHTNSAASAPSRLIDLGVEGFLVKESLKCVCAQRLLPKLCENCSQEVSPQMTDASLLKLGIDPLWIPHGSVLKSAAGCPFCRETGYVGRIAVVEGFWISDAIKAIIISKEADSSLITKEMEAQGGRSLFMQGVELASKGVVDLATVLQLR